MNYFDFGCIENSERIIKKTWIELRDALKHKEFSYRDIDKAKGTTFLSVFDSLFFQNNGFDYITKKTKDIMGNMGRGTKLNPSEQVNYERFIPKKEYITDDNRFSPVGVEWLYLALDTSIRATEVSKKEIRIHTGERFGFCSFVFDDSVINNQIVDLTIADQYSYGEINAELENYVQAVSKEKISKAKIMQRMPERGQIMNQDEFSRVFTNWAIHTYCKLLSEQIFLPVNTDDKSIVYAPFHTIAQYFISLGYSGIIYKSTVCEGGKNLVLFDKNYAHPLGNIIDIVL